MDLEALFGLDAASAIPPPSTTPKGPECVNTPSADDDAAFEAWVCRAIERDLGLSPGSLELWDPIKPKLGELP